MSPEQTKLVNALTAAGAQIARDFRAAVEKMIPVWEEIGLTLRVSLGEIFQMWNGLKAEHVVAYKWAERVHPEWVKIMRRTKKRRIRKKYADRIWREYLKGKGR